MPPLLEIVVSNTLLAALLAVSAAGSRLLRRPALTHSLWLLVLLKLLTPPIVPVPISWPAANETSSQTEDPSSLPLISLADPASTPDSEPEKTTTILIYPADPESPNSASTPEEPKTAPLPTLHDRLASLWPGLLLPAWLIGSVLYLAWTIWHIHQFQRLLRRARLAPAELQGQVKPWARQLGLRKAPALWLVPGRISPMLWTFGGSPCLLFPAQLLDRLDSDQRSALIVHELAHLRRRDHWVRLVEIMAIAIYWWHPLVWLARRELHEAEEQCCDAWVIWSLTSLGESDSGGRGSCRACRAYALALLHTVDFFSHTRPTLPAAASGVGPIPHLRRRLTMIMNGNTSKSLSAFGWLAVGTLSLLLPLVPIQAQQAPDPKDPDSRDQKIESLKKVIRALEDQQQAEKTVQRAAAEQAQRARVLQERADAVRALRLQEETHAKVADELKKIEDEKLKADEQQLRAIHFLRQAQLAQTPNADPEQHREIRRARVDEPNPDFQRAERVIEEITRAMEQKHRELRSLEEKLLHARADLEKMRAESAQREANRRSVEVIRRDATPSREALIIKVDPRANAEDIKKTIEEIRLRTGQPVHVEIVNPNEPGRQPKEAVRELRFRTAEPNRDPQGAAKEPRLTEPRNDRGSDLEQKLDRIMKEVEELRRELHSGSRK
jgi:bla regulator protein blaR1